MIELAADTKLGKEESKNGATKFQIMTRERVYVLIAPDETEMMSWLNALRLTLQTLRGENNATTETLEEGVATINIQSMQGVLWKKKRPKDSQKNTGKRRSSLTKLASHASGTSTGWQKRYFVLSQGRLRWMLEDACGEVLNFLDLSEPGVGVKLDELSDRPWSFRLECGSGIRLLAAESEEEMRAWVNALQKNIVLGEVHQQGTASPLGNPVSASSYENFVGAEVADTGMELQPVSSSSSGTISNSKSESMV